MIKHYTLADIAQVLPPFPFRGSIEPHAEGDALAVQLKDVNPGEQPCWERMTRTCLVGRKPYPFLEQGDILLAIRGSRYFAVHLDQIPEPAVASPHFFVVRIKHGGVLPAYVAWICSYGPAQQYWTAQETGTMQRNLKRADVESLPLPLPDIVRQRQFIEAMQRIHRHKQLSQHMAQADEALLHALAAQI